MKHFSKMQATERNSHRVYLMHVQRGRCYYCNCQMERYIPEKGVPIPPNCITFEHLVDEWSPSGKIDDIDNIVLACYECNTKRGQARQVLAMELLYTTFKTRAGARQFMSRLNGNKQSPRIRSRLEEFGLLSKLQSVQLEAA